MRTSTRWHFGHFVCAGGRGASCHYRHEVRIGDVAVLADIQPFHLLFSRHANPDSSRENLPEDHRDHEHKDRNTNDARKLRHEKPGATAKEKTVAGRVGGKLRLSK